MNHLIRATAALAASAAVLSFASAGFAQDQAAAPRQPPTAEQRAEWRQQHQAERAQQLTAVLNLRADQQPALQAFLAAMKPNHEGRHGPEAGEGRETAMTTPQRLDWMAERMARHEAAFHQRADAIRTFYAVLSPEQQRAFDALPMLMGGHEHGGRGERQDHRDGGPIGRQPADAS